MDLSPRDEIMLMLKNGAEKIATELKPDEDWMPVCAFITNEGERVIVNVPPFNNEADKPRAMGMLAQLLEGMGAVAAGVVFTGWGLSLDMTDPGTAAFMTSGMLPSKHPARQEVIVIYTMDRYYKGIICSQSNVERSETEPPVIAEWNDHGSQEISGQMVDPIYKAIQSTKTEEVMH